MRGRWLWALVVAAMLTLAGCASPSAAHVAAGKADPALATTKPAPAPPPGPPPPDNLSAAKAAAAALAARWRYLNEWVPPTWLPGHLFVVYYGNPLSKYMGVLGEGTTASMLARLRKQAAAYAALSSVPVQPALDLVATVAQGSPQPDGTYRLRMPASLILQESRLAQENHMPLFLDIQVGHSPVPTEVAALAPYLKLPWVELALDPEFDMPPGQIPDRTIGTMRASDVNWTIKYLAALVKRDHLPQKVLIVHQWTHGMLPDWSKIQTQPGVALVIDMDGFGGQSIKQANYVRFIKNEPIPGRFGGIKLFYTLDHPLFTPQQVLDFTPTPALVMYQ